VLASGLIFGLCAWLARIINTEKLKAEQSKCSGNLTAIGLALQQYNETYGTFPPAFLVDASGKPAHSWRVLILSIMGGQYRRIYDSYNFAEPWDGPNNRKLAHDIPNFYICPNHPNTQNLNDTNYVAVTGVGTIFPPGKATKLTNVNSGNLNTLMVVEVAGESVGWMEPVELNIHRNGKDREKNERRLTMSSADPGGSAALFSDGTTRRYEDALTVEDMKQLGKRSGLSTR
jgi:hypothetical protein